jgi:hypothetical protein
VDISKEASAFQAQRAEEAGRGREKASVGYNRNVANNWPAEMKRK